MVLQKWLIKKRIRVGSLVSGVNDILGNGLITRDFCSANFKTGFVQHCAIVDENYVYHPDSAVISNSRGRRFVYWNGGSSNTIQDQSVIFW